MQNYKTCPKCSGTLVPYTKGVGETFWNRRYMPTYKMTVVEPTFWKCTHCEYESIKIEPNKQILVHKH